MTDNSLPDTVSISALAGLFDVTTRQARNLLDGANVKPAARGAWPLGVALRSILADARRNREVDVLSQARARAIVAKARSLEVALAEKEHELVPMMDALGAQDALVAAIRAELDGLPARFTRDIEVRRKLEAEIQSIKVRVVAALASARTEIRTGEIPD